MPHDIFICYSRSDRETADKLVGRLRAAGWSVFQDVNTRVGRRWHKEIERELHAARAVVVLWSDVSRDSDFVLEEAEYGKRKDILFPVFIERVEYPYGFGRIQTADLVDWGGDGEHPGLEQLLQALTLHLDDAPGSEFAPAAAPKLHFPPPGTTFRDTLRCGGEGPLMAVIPPGTFVMGSPPDEPARSDGEGPQHTVRITQPFAIGVYAVTFDDYDRFACATGAALPEDEGWGRASRPVINVSWRDAQAYCAWLADQSGQSYRLPSEAEWEYACRAGATTPFHFGARLSTALANFDGNYTYNGSAKGEYRVQTLPVGSFPPNAFGLYDMHGNAWEWCQDAWHDSYKGAPQDGAAWEAESALPRVLRGGSWGNDPRLCRAALRNGVPPDYRDDDVGFRVCRGSPIEPPETAPPDTGPPKR